MKTQDCHGISRMYYTNNILSRSLSQHFAFFQLLCLFCQKYKYNIFRTSLSSSNIVLHSCHGSTNNTCELFIFLYAKPRIYHGIFEASSIPFAQWCVEVKIVPRLKFYEAIVDRLQLFLFQFSSLSVCVCLPP